MRTPDELGRAIDAVVRVERGQEEAAAVAASVDAESVGVQAAEAVAEVSRAGQAASRRKSGEVLAATLRELVALDSSAAVAAATRTFASSRAESRLRALRALGAMRHPAARAAIAGRTRFWIQATQEERGLARRLLGIGEPPLQRLAASKIVAVLVQVTAVGLLVSSVMAHERGALPEIGQRLLALMGPLLLAGLGVVAFRVAHGRSSPAAAFGLLGLMLCGPLGLLALWGFLFEAMETVSAEVRAACAACSRQLRAMSTPAGTWSGTLGDLAQLKLEADHAMVCGRCEAKVCLECSGRRASEMGLREFVCPECGERPLRTIFRTS